MLSFTFYLKHFGKMVLQAHMGLTLASQNDGMNI